MCKISRIQFNRIYTKLVQVFGFPESQRDISYFYLCSGKEIEYAGYHVTYQGSRKWEIDTDHDCAAVEVLEEWIYKNITCRKITNKQLQEVVYNIYQRYKPYESEDIKSFPDFVEDYLRNRISLMNGLRCSEKDIETGCDLAATLWDNKP